MPWFNLIYSRVVKKNGEATRLALLPHLYRIEFREKLQFFGVFHLLLCQRKLQYVIHIANIMKL